MPMSPLFRLSTLILSAAVLVGGLTACAPLVIGGAFFGTVNVATDRRTAETQLLDEAIELRVFNRLITSTNNKGRVSAVSYGRRVLLLGEVPTAEDKVMAERVAASVDNVQRVISELKVMPNASAGQRSQDALITKRIQTALIGDKDLVSSAFKITTNQSTVYVLGVVTPREADRAIGIVRMTPGVKQVVNMVDLISEETLKGLMPTGPGAASTAPAATSAPAASTPSAPPGAIPAPPTVIAPGQPL
ncbi:OsmY Predicted periplasmic or secreted lipoprotein [Burkholderiaceae bacterium]